MDRRHPTRTEVSGALEASSASTPFTTLGGRGQTCFSPDPTISCEESPHRACYKIRRFTVGENSPVEPQLVGVLRRCGPGPQLPRAQGCMLPPLIPAWGVGPRTKMTTDPHRKCANYECASGVCIAILLRHNVTRR